MAHVLPELCDLFTKYFDMRKSLTVLSGICSAYDWRCLTARAGHDERVCEAAGREGDSGAGAGTRVGHPLVEEGHGIGRSRGSADHKVFKVQTELEQHRVLEAINQAPNFAISTELTCYCTSYNVSSISARVGKPALFLVSK